MRDNFFLNLKEIANDEDWELFARDYLSEKGFVIEADPGRGHDRGKDLLVSEQLKGKIRSQKFTWLVSCKHFVISNKSVGVKDEENVLDRLEHHCANGFMGFYSTIASSSLMDRLHDFVKNDKLIAFEVFDRKKIEASFYKDGMSNLAIRYFPESYRAYRPIQNLWGDYQPLYCEVCGTDILEDSILEPQKGIILIAYPVEKEKDAEKLRKDVIHSVYTVCKGDCDRSLEQRLFRHGYITGWEDIHDLCNPILFMKNIMGYLNNIRGGAEQVSDEAHDKMKKIYLILAQRVLREVNEEDKKRGRDSAWFNF